MLRIRDRSQRFLSSPDINGAVGENRESFTVNLFRTAPREVATSPKKVGSPPRNALVLVLTVYFPIEIDFNLKIRKCQLL